MPRPIVAVGVLRQGSRIRSWSGVVVTQDHCTWGRETTVSSDARSTCALPVYVGRQPGTSCLLSPSIVNAGPGPRWIMAWQLGQSGRRSSTGFTW